eukprot:TRINITY_DN1712_c0_g1_i2.p1 TRINITY_DN1712_c0_g1~~TRINITY_DN1712_c0_g1_i2.p1  ORF type:complete len:1194 (-),score=244.04 TRINITY_DN1712_c0_g1_i2:143-3724(-)
MTSRHRKRFSSSEERRDNSIRHSTDAEGGRRSITPNSLSKPFIRANEKSRSSDTTNSKSSGESDTRGRTKRGRADIKRSKSAKSHKQITPSRDIRRHSHSQSPPPQTRSNLSSPSLPDIITANQDEHPVSPQQKPKTRPELLIPNLRTKLDPVADINRQLSERRIHPWDRSQSDLAKTEIRSSESDMPKNLPEDSPSQRGRQMVDTHEDEPYVASPLTGLENKLFGLRHTQSDRFIPPLSFPTNPSPSPQGPQTSRVHQPHSVMNSLSPTMPSSEEVPKKRSRSSSQPALLSWDFNALWHLPDEESSSQEEEEASERLKLHHNPGTLDVKRDSAVGFLSMVSPSANESGVLLELGEISYEVRNGMRRLVGGTLVGFVQYHMKSSSSLIPLQLLYSMRYWTDPVEFISIACRQFQLQQAIRAEAFHQSSKGSTDASPSTELPSPKSGETDVAVPESVKSTGAKNEAGENTEDEKDKDKDLEIGEEKPSEPAEEKATEAKKEEAPPNLAEKASEVEQEKEKEKEEEKEVEKEKEKEKEEEEDPVPDYKTFTIYLSPQTKKVSIYSPDSILESKLVSVAFQRGFDRDTREARTLQGELVTDLAVPLKKLRTDSLFFLPIGAKIFDSINGKPIPGQKTNKLVHFLDRNAKPVKPPVSPSGDIGKPVAGVRLNSEPSAPPPTTHKRPKRSKAEILAKKSKRLSWVRRGRNAVSASSTSSMSVSDSSTSLVDEAPTQTESESPDANKDSSLSDKRLSRGGTKPPETSAPAPVPYSEGQARLISLFEKWIEYNVNELVVEPLQTQMYMFTSLLDVADSQKLSRLMRYRRVGLSPSSLVEFCARLQRLPMFAKKFTGSDFSSYLVNELQLVEFDIQDVFLTLYNQNLISRKEKKDLSEKEQSVLNPGSHYKFTLSRRAIAEEISREFGFTAATIPSSHSVMDFPAQLFAKQLAIFEHRLFTKVSIHEVNYWIVGDPKERSKMAPNLERLTRLVNVVSNWVATEIVMTPNIKKRATLIARFISLAQHSYTLRNYAGLLEISLGLKHAAVLRMKKTWAAVPEASIELLESLELVVSPLNNWYHFRKLLEKQTDMNYIPYIGIYMADITFIKDGPGSKISNGQHGWRKNEQIANILAKLHAVRQSSKGAGVPDPEIQKFLATELYCIEENDLFKRSRELEPAGRKKRSSSMHKDPGTIRKKVTT